MTCTQRLPQLLLFILHASHNKKYDHFISDLFYSQLTLTRSSLMQYLLVIAKKIGNAFPEYLVEECFLKGRLFDGLSFS